MDNKFYELGFKAGVEFGLLNAAAPAVKAVKAVKVIHQKKSATTNRKISGSRKYGPEILNAMTPEAKKEFLRRRRMMKAYRKRKQAEALAKEQALITTN